MNLIVNKTELQRVPAYVTESETRNSIWFFVLFGLSLLLHSFIAYSQRPFVTGGSIELIFGAINFGAIVFLFYGISRLYFSGNFIFLGVSTLLAIVLSIVTAGRVSALMITAGWSAVVLTPVTCGYLARKNYLPMLTFGLSLIVLAVFSSLQLFPMWVKMIWSADEVIRLLTADFRQVLTGAGYTPEAITKIMEQFSLFYKSFIRIVPAMTIMAVMFQFTLGYFWFVRWRRHSGNFGVNVPSFLHWKAPFALTPAIVAAIIMRLAGNEFFVLVADNLILMLAVFYSITGLSLMEFFTKKFYVSTIGKVLIYFLLIVSHVIGFALLAVLGFVDSFYDWRRKYPLPLDFKTS